MGKVLMQMKPISKLLLAAILLLSGVLVVFPGMSLFGLFVGSCLFVLTLLLAMFEGKVGMIFSVSLNLIGAVCTYAQCIRLESPSHLVSAVFQVGVAIACGMIGILSQRQMELNEELQNIAYVDLTTGAYSHRYFHEHYNKRMQLESNLVNDGIILFDIDNFKKINESHGYDFGDSVLRNIAEIIQPLCSEEMSLCRLGGDVFGVYCPDFSLHQAEETVAGLKVGMEDFSQVTEGGNRVKISGSFGLAHYPGTSASMNNLLQDSFEALNHAKNSGRNNVRIFKNMVEEMKGLVADDPQMEVSLKVMLGLINKKDAYTEGHSLRVADYIYKFGSALGIEKEVLRQLKVVSLLHDIGKVNIPIEILTKPSKLSTAEFQVIQTHVELGAELIKKIAFATDYSEVILSHHERYDGNGYPSGLKGEAIPYYARVIGIVDAYDAMISKRPYRQPLTQDEIIREYQRGRGSQFDPDLADRFVGLLETGYFC